MELHLEWQDGRLVVDSQRANQSHGALLRVWRKILKNNYLSPTRPERVLILGFGAGSAAQVLLREMRLACHVVGVDGDPAILGIAELHFGWSPSAELELHPVDAAAFLNSEARSFNLILVDLFEDDQHSFLLDTSDFLTDLKTHVAPSGRLLINTVDHGGNYPDRSARLARDLRLLFDHVDVVATDEVNQVFIAW
jgi:spermidine synthase